LMVVILTVVLLASVVACGAAPAVPTASAAVTTAAAAADTTAASGSDQKITLSALAGQSTTDAGIEDMINKTLSAKYPNITIQWEAVDWGKDFHPKMQQYIQSGLPDIMIGKAQDVAAYAPQGLLADMTGKPYMSKVLDAATAGVTMGGKTYGVVFNALYQGVYYNRKLFADNNIQVPKTQAELKTVIDKLNSLKITPFATHFVDSWSIGNITMQFMMNDLFNKTPDWGDQFRAGKAAFATTPEMKTAYEYNKLIYDNTWKKETFSLQQTDCDTRLVQGKAGMKVSGSWSIQNFMNVDPNFDFGIFPFPNQTGDSKLIFEPNLTFMASAKSKNLDAIDKVLDLITSDKDLQLQIYNYTKTAPMLKDVSPTFPNASQKDIDKYAAAGQIINVGIGNNQLQWGGFQDQNANDIAAYLQGKETIDAALKASDSRKANSKP
jgi:ABC-type glycerol-3-phosphate transport system substrate-binding protein